MIVSTCSRSSSSEPSVMSASSRLAGKLVSVITMMMGSARWRSRSCNGEVLTAGFKWGGQVSASVSAGEGGKADRHRSLELRAADEDRIGEAREQRLRDLLAGAQVLGLEENGELVAADPRAAGRRRCDLGEHLGEIAQQMIPGNVAVKV